MKILLISFILLLSFSVCKKENDKIPPEKKHMYTDSLTGTSLYSNPELDSSIVEIIPHASRIELLSENPAYSIQRDSTTKWRKIQYENSSGWVVDTNLSDRVEKNYFSVVTTTGLPLREKPDPKSKIMTTIPLGYIGEFNNRLKENTIIKGQPGYWMEVIYNGKKGWVFSGFTTISKNLQSLEERTGEFGDEGWFYRFYSNLEESKLEEVEFDPNSIETTAKVQKYENYPYTIYQIQRQVAEDDCSGKEKQVIFKNNLTGKSFGNREIYSEVVVEQNSPLTRSVYTTSVPQKCGCLVEDYTLYFLLDDRVLAAPFRNKNSQAYCEYGPISNVEIERENRYDYQNNTVFMYLQLPDCQPDEKILLYGGRISQIKNFKTDMFVSLKLTNEEVFVEKFYQKGIPEKFQTDWEKADPTTRSAKE